MAALKDRRLPCTLRAILSCTPRSHRGNGRHIVERRDWVSPSVLFFSWSLASLVAGFFPFSNSMSLR